MVIDQVKHASMYMGLSKRLAAALRYINETDFSGVKPGRYEIEGSEVYALVLEYQTKPRAQGAWESHRRYFDLQYVAEGSELLGYSNLEHLNSGKYDEARDSAPADGEGEFLLLRKGTFAILGPQDAHMPGIAEGEPKPVRKVVVKVRVGDD